jgi:spore germination cell wall hydrolase CwlJ-like protein
MKILMVVISIFYAVAVWATSESVPYSADEYPEAHCLALNLYFEARGSSFADKVAVSDVVINRANDERYPHNICEVVYDAKLDSNGFPIRNQCQFSWFCDGKSDNPKDQEAWYEAQVIAYQMLYNGKYLGITEGATHYHSTGVDPYWAESFQYIGQVGDHRFYRWN